METGVRPAGGAERGPHARRHPTHVHNDMEAIFGIPPALAGATRTHSAGVKVGFTGAVATRDWLWSPRMWLGLVSLAALVVVGIAVSIWWTAGRHGHYSVQLAASSEERGPVPVAAKLLAVPRPVAPADIARNAVPSPQAIAVQRPAPQARPVAPVEETRPPVAPPARTDTAKSAVAPSDAVAATASSLASGHADGRCSGTGYEHMPACPPATVLKADSALSAAYASAISTNVDARWLAQYSQHWSQLRQSAAADPDATVAEFSNMTSQLNALVVARTRLKR